jgi:hypothetical protein
MEAAGIRGKPVSAAELKGRTGRETDRFRSEVAGQEF